MLENFIDLKNIVNKYKNDYDFQNIFGNCILSYLNDKSKNYIIYNEKFIIDNLNESFKKEFYLKTIENGIKLKSSEALYILTQNNLTNYCFEAEANEVIKKCIDFLDNNDFLIYINQTKNINMNYINERIKSDGILARKIYKEKKKNNSLGNIEDDLIINSMFLNVNDNMINDYKKMKLLLEYGRSQTIKSVLEYYYMISEIRLESPKNYEIIKKLEDKLFEYNDYDILYDLAVYLKEINEAKHKKTIDKIIKILIENKKYDYIIKSSIYLDNSMFSVFENYENLFNAIELMDISTEEKKTMEEKALSTMSNNYFDINYKDMSNDDIKNNIIKKFK